MLYPDFIKPGDLIGVTACSDGMTSEPDLRRLDHAGAQLAKRGYQVLETPDVRSSLLGRSTDARERVKELYELLENDKIRAIIQACGGDYLSEILPFLDFKTFAEHPKWLQGFSDPTGLLFSVTVACDMATIYGNNFGDFGMAEWHPSVTRHLELLEGTLLEQKSYSYYMDSYRVRETGLEGYADDRPVYWKALSDGKQRLDGEALYHRHVAMSGRLLGGCLDVLLNLVGTRFDHVKEFCSRYSGDGILWYLESFHLNSEQLYLGLFQLREAGWFENASGFWFGRPAFYESDYGITYEDAVFEALKELHVPVVLDADFGHKPPRMAVVNGACGTISCEHGGGSLRMEFC